MRVFSFGGGVQSTAAMILSARGELPYTHFIMSNVGDDSENPLTLKYVHDVIIPYTYKHGLVFEEVKHQPKEDQPQTLYELVISDKTEIPIPVYLAGSGPANRQCTSRWKIKVIEKWMRENANATKGNRKPVGVGISVDESHRMRTDDPQREPYVYKEYPLIDMMLTRSMCQEIIRSEGLPLAPKSSCWFCPFMRKSQWQSIRAEQPELFAKAIELEKIIQQKRIKNGKDLAYLTASNMPLQDAIPLASVNMFGDDDDNLDFCESGYCMT